MIPAQIRVQKRLEITQIKGNILLKSNENLVPGRGLELERFPQRIQ